MSTSAKNQSSRLGVLLIGMGAISTTLVAGVAAISQGLARPFGSLTQLAQVTPPGGGRKTVGLSEYLQLARLEDLVFGGWDIHAGNAYEMAVAAAVLEPMQLAAVRPVLEAITP
ncbi:MAG: inositol-3-phosphate synthase, partial [Terriglobales bacterium]